MSCNQMSADYLFMQDKLYDVKYDTGDKVIQCGRHNDIFKLWLQWRAKVSFHQKNIELKQEKQNCFVYISSKLCNICTKN